MNFCIFDTETTSLDRPFCYNIGYILYNTETSAPFLEREYTIEQVWQNLPLFASAYYADKRKLYVLAMRQHKILQEKFGYVCQQMIRDFKRFDVESAYAYNSDFDEKVFEFNCDWYKCNNPFDSVPIFDIRAYAIQFLVDNNYKSYCEQNELFTDAGNYSTTAETMVRYLTENMEYSEQHTALADSQDELMILKKSLERGGVLNTDYNCPKSIPRIIKRPFTIKVDKQTIYQGEYIKKYVRQDTYNFTTSASSDPP